MTREDLGLPPERFDPVVIEAGKALADESQPAGSRTALRKMLQAALDMWSEAVRLPAPKEPSGAKLVRRRRTVR
jgi:hypothetical protein